jgi:hypothetical protein
MKRFLYLFCILTVVSACKEVFEAPPLALLQGTLLNSSTQKTITSKITVLGIGRDSLWEKETSLKEIMLPLSAHDTTNYLISFDSQIDTITFFHETIKKYASMETGFYYQYKLRSIKYTHHRIDSIQITDSLVTEIWHENIKLYIHPLSAGGN